MNREGGFSTAVNILANMKGEAMKTIGSNSLILTMWLMCAVGVGTPDNALADSGSTWEKVVSYFNTDKRPSVETIVEETKEIKDSCQELSADYVIEGAKKTNKLLSVMNSEVREKSWFFFEKTDQDQLKEIVGRVKDLSDFYTKLASNKEAERENIKFYAGAIKKFASEIQQKISDEKSFRQKLQAEQKSLGSMSAGEQRQIKERVLEGRIRMCESRIKMLEGFSQNYQRLTPAMESFSITVERFIFIVEEGAKLYKDGYETLKLSKEIADAYQIIASMKSLDPVSEEVMASWRDMEEIVNTLTQQVQEFGNSL